MNPSECLQDAMGMIDEKFVAEVTEQCPLTAAPRRPWVKWVTTVAACLCLAIGVTTVLQWHRTLSIRKNVLDKSSDASSDVFSDIFWADGSLPVYYHTGSLSTNVEKSESDISASNSTTSTSSGWRMSDTLKKTLSLAENSDKRFAILVSPVFHGNETFEAYVYQGRTRRQWEAYREACFAEQEKRLMLLKEGDALKYGEALYTTGTPEGEKWAKSLYDERVAYYGTEFLARYIVDGELLREVLEQEVQTYLTEYESVAYILSDLVAQYRAEKSLETAATLTEQGLLCEVRRDRLFLFVTPRQLKGIDGIKKDDFTLTQASRRMYDESYDLFLKLDTSVTGFDTDKLSITTDYIRPRVMKSDADVIEALRILYDLYQYADDSYLSVSISAGASVTDEDVARLGGEVTYRAKYFDNISVRVPYDRLDLQALCDLTRRADVSYIHIGPPEVPDTAG